MTTIYRAADDTELFIGAHFAATRLEAVEYTQSEGFGGADVWSMELTGEVAEADGLEELAELMRELGLDDSDVYGGFAQGWKDCGYDFVFHVIENDRKVRKALEASRFSWIRFSEPSITGCGISVTYRYLGN